MEELMKELVSIETRWYTTICKVLEIFKNSLEVLDIGRLWHTKTSKDDEINPLLWYG